MILAGGHSERFGKPKAFAEIEGQPFYGSTDYEVNISTENE